MIVTVVVPVRNEEDSIGFLLDGLFEQTLQPAAIVITDGGSTDKTVEIIEKRIEAGKPLKILKTDISLPGRGRNLAAQHATSEWLAFTDAGVIPDPNWLEALAEQATDDIDVVYGSYEPILDSFFKECAAIAYVPPKTPVDGTWIRAGSIVSAMMRRFVWEKAGGFPEHLRSAEDLLFMRSVEATGARIAYAPRAVVQWNVQPTWLATFKRFKVYSRNNIIAGLWKEWQAAIVTRFCLLLSTALPAFFFGVWWLWITVGCILGMLFLRSVVAVWRNRQSYPASVLRNLARLVVLVPLIGLVDLAAIAGILSWVWNDKLQFQKPQETTHGA